MLSGKGRVNKNDNQSVPPDNGTIQIKLTLFRFKNGLNAQS